jgi:pimeloyl-ACP methyl ester carboxylesterase
VQDIVAPETVGPLGIKHVAGMRPALIERDAKTLPLYTANGKALGMHLGTWLGATLANHDHRCWRRRALRCGFFRVEASGTLQPIRAPFRPEAGYFHTDGWRGKQQHFVTQADGTAKLSIKLARSLPSTNAIVHAFLARPGQADIQSELFYDYRNNLAAFPTWQAWLRERQPSTLIVWGKYDPVFDIAEVAALKNDLPKAEIHILDGDHFVLDESLNEVAKFMRHFLEKHSQRGPKNVKLISRP